MKCNVIYMVEVVRVKHEHTKVRHKCEDSNEFRILKQHQSKNQAGREDLFFMDLEAKDKKQH